MSSRPKSTDLSLLKIDLNDLMRQICLKDMELFKAITIEEINSFCWTKANKKEKCPQLMMSTKQFNKINMWVQKEILDHVNTTKGVKILSKFIKLSKCLLDNNDFQSAYSVKAALDSTPIHRLEQLWSGIDKHHRMIWDRLCLVFSVEDNYRRLRTSMEAKKLPLIPFLGVYLSDLTGLDAAHPKVDGVETEIRKSCMQKIYDCILYYQNSRYDFKHHDGIQKYLQSMEYMEEFENYMIDHYFYISKELEPDVGSKASDSSHASSLAVPHILVTQTSEQYTNMYKKRNSPDTNHRASYRVISEQERKLNPLILPDSPTMTEGRQTKSLLNDSPGNASRNLLDDSECLPQNDNKSNHSGKGLKHTNSSSSLSNSTLFGTSPAINFSNSFGSLHRTEIERTSYVQYPDPDILTINQSLKQVLVGVVKRKIKSKSSMSFSAYQKVLARLFTNQLDCFLRFYTAKTSKAKKEDDFREEFHASISLLDAKLDSELLINDPKIYITLPHETYVIQSIDDHHHEWPSLNTWCNSIKESIAIVVASKAAVSVPQPDLINLDDEFTRL